MPSCLGIYIEDNLIKYAKVSKNNEAVKIESFGVKFYENFEDTIKQIIEETYSFNIPISINTSEEWYNEIRVFSLLSKQDIKNAIKTEFEHICYDKDKNRNMYEERHFFTKSNVGDDKIRAIHVAVPKISLEQQKNRFSKYKVSSISPISVAILNLLKADLKGTNIVINIEKETYVTKIKDGEITNIDVVGIGAQEILNKINLKENSFAKSYEICKNSTIYTDNDLQYEENEYLEDIMPTLFQIVSNIKNSISENFEKVDNIYISGTGSIINNIDIYFQEYFKDIHCEILRPSFINTNSKINLKDYIEVNSAIAIGLQGLQKNNMNFKPGSNTKEILSADVKSNDVVQFFSKTIEKYKKQIDLFSTIFIMITIGYFISSLSINGLLEKKSNEVNSIRDNVNSKISQVQSYKAIFEDRIYKYDALINKIQNLNNINSEEKRFKNTIPNLLNNVMAVMPKGVQLVSMENTIGTHVTIVARSKELQQVAYLKTKLQTEGILKDVVSDTGRSVVYVNKNVEEVYLFVTIEGELP